MELLAVTAFASLDLSDPLVWHPLCWLLMTDTCLLSCLLGWKWQGLECCYRHSSWCHFDGLVQERRNSSALAMELHLSCTNPSICTLSWMQWFMTILYLLLISLQFNICDFQNHYQRWSIIHSIFLMHFVVKNTNITWCCRIWLKLFYLERVNTMSMENVSTNNLVQWSTIWDVI